MSAEPNMSTSTDWYCTKNRVAHFVGRESNVGEVSDYVMDSAYKWVNGELQREDIDPFKPELIPKLKADADLEMAMVWYACDLMTTVISGNQHHGRILPDGIIASQSFAQGDISMTYHKAEPTEHYEEMTTPDFHMRAQRAMRRFFNKLTDEFKRTKKSVMAIKNRLHGNEADYANRLYTRTQGFRGYY